MPPFPSTLTPPPTPAPSPPLLATYTCTSVPPASRNYMQPSIFLIAPTSPQLTSPPQSQRLQPQLGNYVPDNENSLNPIFLHPAPLSGRMSNPPPTSTSTSPPYPHISPHPYLPRCKSSTTTPYSYRHTRPSTTAIRKIFVICRD